MWVGHQLLVVLVIQVCLAAKEDVDIVDTEPVGDNEAQLKCDACKIVAFKFGEAFGELQDEVKEDEIPADEDIVSVAESVCDDVWEGYATAKVDGEDRVSGLGSDIGVVKEAADDGPIWSRRLQDMCDEFLAEVNDEKILFHSWASGNSLEDHICRGEGTFSVCVADDWGPWPGDDYEDYEDAGDFDDIHDEF